MNNIQRILKLQGGAAGQWNVRAELRLAELLSKPIAMKSAAPGTLEDKKPLAIKDKKPLVIKDKPPSSSGSNNSSSSESSSDEDKPAQPHVDLKTLQSRLASANASLKEKDKKIAAAKEEFESIFDALHHCQAELVQAKKLIRRLRAELALSSEESGIDIEMTED